MTQGFYTTNTSGYKITMPEYSEWQMEIFGPNGYIVNPLKKHQPNWFHRQMMQLFFGVKWTRISKS